MIRALFLLLLALPAYAQTIPFSLPQCVPDILAGPGKGLRVFKGMYGRCFGYWCPEGTSWVSWTHCRVNGVADSVGDDSGLVSAGTSLEAMHWFIHSTEVVPVGDQVDKYNALHVAAKADLLASKPVSLWVVDSATSADGTRPAFALVNGVRAETSTARAKSGQPCKPEIAQSPSAVAGKVFAAYGPNYAPGMVALCRKG